MKAAKLEPNKKSVVFPSWGEMFKFSFSGFFGNIKSYLVLALVVGGLDILVVTAYQAVLFGFPSFELGTAGLVVAVVLYLFFSVIVGLLWALSFPTAALKVAKGEGFRAMEVLRASFEKMWQGFVLFMRIFWYVTKWFLVPLVVVLVLWMIMVTIYGASGLGVEAGLIESGGSLSNLSPEVGLDGRGAFAAVLASILSFLGLGIIFAGIYFVIDRGNRVIFAFYAFADGRDSKESLETSKSMVQGSWWKTFWYNYSASFVMSLIFVIPVMFFSVAVGFAIFSFDNEAALNIWMNGWTTAAGVFMAGPVTIFLGQLYLYLKKAKKI